MTFKVDCTESHSRKTKKKQRTVRKGSGYSGVLVDVLLTGKVIKGDVSERIVDQVIDKVDEDRWSMNQSSMNSYLLR